MTTAVVAHLNHIRPATAAPRIPPTGPTVGWAVSAASDVVAGVPLDDPRWDIVGPPLTNFVRATRLAVGMPESPIGADEAVAAVLRLRDLSRLAQITAAIVAFATPEVEAGLRSLQAAAASC